jgi:putative hydrolase
MFKSDLHTHSIASGHAFSTVWEMARFAKEKGIEVLAITDHGPAVKSAVNAYFRCFDRIPKKIEGVRVLSGVEANIINEDGGIDLPEKILEKLDIVIAGFHGNVGCKNKDVKTNTEIAIKVIQNPLVKMFSHPYDGTKGGANNLDLDMEIICKEASSNGVALEINASYFYKESRFTPEMIKKINEMILYAKKYNAKLIMNSDAHSAFEVGKFEEVIEKFSEFNLSEKDFMNNDFKEIEEFFGVKL